VQQKVLPELKRFVEKGKTIRIGEFFVTPFPVPHDSSDNVGYMIEAEGVCFCIITDAGYVTDEMKPFISKANYLVIEANHDEEMVNNGPYPQFLKGRILSKTGHLSNRSCGLALVENMTEELRYVWLCHLSEENNHPELARKTVESILRDYGIIVGVDVKMEVLKRTTPSGVYELD
jgi:phosphoribosyl 1,2-cyclic phosphodiesterase